MDKLNVEIVTEYDEDESKPHPLRPDDGLLFLPDCQTLDDLYGGKLSAEVIHHNNRMRTQLMQCDELQFIDIKIPHENEHISEYFNNLIPMLLTVPLIHSMEIGNHTTFNNERIIDNSDIPHNITAILEFLELTRDLCWSDSACVMVYISSHIPLTLDQIQPLLDYENDYSYRSWKRSIL